MSSSTTFISSTLMSQSLHLAAKNISGSGPPDGRCLSLSGFSRRTAAVSVSPCSSQGIQRVFSQAKIRSSKGASGTPAFVCKASSGGHRRNSDYSRQGRQGYSRNRGRQNEERDSYETLDESELLTSSKNGPLLSFPNNSKSQATAAPGPREKEIVELFRKVQAQLRERASVKEDKKVDTPQGKGRENETVDSLLKLLRKHSVEQGGSQKVTNGDLGMYHPEQSWGGYNESKSSSSSSVLHSDNISRNGAVESSETSFTRRPPSSFRRRSPIPRVKLPPVDSSEDDLASKGHLNSSGEKTKEHEVISSDATTIHEAEPKPEEEPVAELLQGSDDLFDEEELSEDEALDSDENKEEGGEKQELDEKEDLSTLKLAELRAMAKSRGIKGYSKMKKNDLVNLLTAGISD